MGVAIADKAELSRRLCEALSSEQELFIAEIAAGVPITQAAVSAGFCSGYADELITKEPIRSRLLSLLDQRDAEGFPPRAWIELQMVKIIRVGLDGANGRTLIDANGKPVAIPHEPPNHTLALSALMNLAKLKGFIVDKSSKVSAKLDLGKLPPGQVREMFSKQLNDMAPGAGEKIKRLLESQAATFDAEPESDPPAPSDPPVDPTAF